MCDKIIEALLVDLPEILTETIVMWILFIFNHTEWKKRYIDIYDFSNCPGGVNDCRKPNTEE